MKKFKFLTSLSCLGVLAATAPIAITSCSNSKKLEIVIDEYNSDFNYKRNMTGWIFINGYTYDGIDHGNTTDGVWFKDGSLNATCKQSGITVNTDYLNKTGALLVKIGDNIVNGTYAITISGEDQDGHYGSKDVNISVADHAYFITILDYAEWETYNFLYYFEHYDDVDALDIVAYDGNDRIADKDYTVKIEFIQKSWEGDTLPEWFEISKDNKTITFHDKIDPSKSPRIENNSYAWFSYTVTITDPNTKEQTILTNYALFFANYDV